MYDQDLLALYIFLIVVTFIWGFFLGALFSPFRHNARKEPKPWHARRAAAEGEPRHDGEKRSINLAAVVLALVVVSGVIIIDQFEGPFFPDAFYFLGQPNAQQSGDVTVRRPSPMDVRGDGEDE